MPRLPGDTAPSVCAFHDDCVEGWHRAARLPRGSTVAASPTSRSPTERRVAPATIRYELGHLAVALRWAEQKKIIERAPSIWRPAPPERIERHLSRDDFRKRLAGTVAPHACLYMLLGIFTAARPSALLDLTWDRVDFERGTVNLNPPGRQQTAKRRPVVA